MTKKIKFFEDYTKRYFSDIVVTQNKQYDIICEKLAHYNFVDDVGSQSAVLKKNSKYKYEIIEEPKVTKYIKIIDSEDCTITLDKWYEVSMEYPLCYSFINNAGHYTHISKDSTNYIISEGHPHKNLIKKAAELAESTIDISSHFQFRRGAEEGWIDCHSCPAFHPAWEYRIKPNTIKIGNREINAPERKPLKQGQKYFTPYILASDEDLCSLDVWENRFLDKTMLERGLIYLTRQDAIAASELMIELLRGEDK